MHRATLLVAILMFAAISERAPRAEAQPETCPMTVRGTSVAVEDTPGGVSLKFVTTGDVDQLRTVVRSLAALYRRRGSDARAEDIANGARIVLVPRTPGRLATLRALAHKRADYMARGRCDVP
ncbi:MAG: hypothetical protein ACM31C_09000 [Acidobacteriota bacterium]